MSGTRRTNVPCAVGRHDDRAAAAFACDVSGRSRSVATIPATSISLTFYRSGGSAPAG
jgi:hypothetical protein